MKGKDKRKSVAAVLSAAHSASAQPMVPRDTAAPEPTYTHDKAASEVKETNTTVGDGQVLGEEAAHSPARKANKKPKATTAALSASWADSAQASVGGGQRTAEGKEATSAAMLEMTRKLEGQQAAFSQLQIEAAELRKALRDCEAKLAREQKERGDLGGQLQAERTAREVAEQVGVGNLCLHPPSPFLSHSAVSPPKCPKVSFTSFTTFPLRLLRQSLRCGIAATSQEVAGLKSAIAKDLCGGAAEIESSVTLVAKLVANLQLAASQMSSA